MHGLDGKDQTIAPLRRRCLVDGCARKDARIVSTRRAAYFATIAARRGETADRIIEADAAWSVPAMASQVPVEAPTTLGIAG